MIQALASLSLSMLLSSLGTSIANVALPTLAAAFHASFQEVQWVVLAYLLAITTLIVSVGRLGDILGRRRLLLTGLSLFTIASLLGGIAPTLQMLIAARAAQGLGAAVMMALTLAFVGETVPKDRAGSATGLLGATSAIGTALGPSLGGALIAAFGWPSIFLINVPLGLIALGLAYRHLPEDRGGAMVSRPGFDVAGTAVLGLTLAAYALAMTVGRGHFGIVNGALLLAAFVGVALFARVEARATSPLISLTVLANPLLRSSLITSGLVATVVMATLVVGPFYLSGAFGLSTASVGLVLSVGPLVAALTGVPAGRVVDRLGSQPMTSAGLISMALGATLLPLLPTRFGVPGYLLPLAVVTAGYALFQTANNTAVMATVSADQRGVMSGMLNLSRNLGLITGASMMGTLFAVSSGSMRGEASPSAAVVTGMRATFGVAAALVFTALAIARSGQPRVQQAGLTGPTRRRPDWLVPALRLPKPPALCVSGLDLAVRGGRRRGRR